MKRVTNDTWIMFGVLAAIVAVFVLGIYTPQSRRMDQWNAQIAKDKQDLAVDAGLGGTLRPLAERVRELQGRYKDFNRRLPKEVDVGAFYREVCANVSREQLTTPNMKIQSPVREELYSTLPIVLKTEGSYLALGKLLQRLDAMERLTLVEKLELKAAANPATVDVTLLVNIYHTDPETAPHEQISRNP